MAEVTGTTVYVLGAGASCHTGAPLLADFLVSARALTGGRYQENLEYKDSFKNIFNWIDTLRSASYYVEFDLDNLEHIFSLAEMQKQIGSEEGQKLCQDLKHVIVETLDRNILGTLKGKTFEPDPIYSNFVGALDHINKQRRKRTNQAHGTFEKDTIITFNYDVILDHAFGPKNYDYCINEEYSPGKFKILKLHGSANWGICSGCDRRPIQTATPSPLASGADYDYEALAENGEKLPFKMVTHAMKYHKCGKCGETEVLEPYIIPPTWSKKIENSQLERVWKTAVDEIAKACQLIIIGYSMPPTDTFLQYLLTLGLANNPTLHRIVVVNRDNSEDFKQRYRKVFSRSLSGRGRLKFITGEHATFDEFIHFKMETIGTRF